jgi:hypothetical protein
MGYNIYADVCRSETISALLKLKNFPQGTEVMGMVGLHVCVGVCLGGWVVCVFA